MFNNTKDMFNSYPTEDLTPTDPNDPNFWDYDAGQTRMIRRKEALDG